MFATPKPAVALPSPSQPPAIPFEVLVAAAYPQNYDSPKIGQRITLKEILVEVSSVFNVPTNDLISPRRLKTFVAARQIGFALALRFTSKSLPEIGRRFGGKDHATVLYGAKKARKLMHEAEKTLSSFATLREWTVELHRLCDQRDDLWLSWSEAKEGTFGSRS